MIYTVTHQLRIANNTQVTMFDDFLRAVLMQPDPQDAPKTIQLVVYDQCHQPYRYASRPRLVQGHLVSKQAKEMLRRRRILADVPPCPACGHYPTHLLQFAREGQAA